MGKLPWWIARILHRNLELTTPVPPVYRIVPYINPKFTGSISGIIGAGGNVGAVAFGFCFRQMTAKAAFTAMGSIILFSSFLSMFVFIPGQNGLIWKTALPTETIKAAENFAIEEGDSPSKVASNSVASKDSETHVEDSDEHELSEHSDSSL